jgi:uracil-DNA glycosylase
MNGAQPASGAAAGQRACLDSLVRDIRACRICLETPMGRPLPHAPRPVLRVSTTARICICSQAPGVRVHASGKPFTDPSGDRLRQWLAMTGEQFYDQARVAIVPMGMCFPGLNAAGGDLPPRPECAQAWHRHLFAAMPQLQLVLLVGGYAQRFHLGAEAKGGVSATVKIWRTVLDRPGLPRRVPLPHPSWRNNAWLAANAWFEGELLERVRQEVRALL